MAISFPENTNEAEWPWTPFDVKKMPKESFKALYLLKDGNIRQGEWLGTDTAFYNPAYIAYYLPWEAIPKPQIDTSHYAKYQSKRAVNA